MLELILWTRKLHILCSVYWGFHQSETHSELRAQRYSIKSLLAMTQMSWNSVTYCDPPSGRSHLWKEHGGGNSNEDQGSVHSGCFRAHLWDCLIRSQQFYWVPKPFRILITPGLFKLCASWNILVIIYVAELIVWGTPYSVWVAGCPYRSLQPSRMSWSLGRLASQNPILGSGVSHIDDTAIKVFIMALTNWTLSWGASENQKLRPLINSCIIGFEPFVNLNAYSYGAQTNWGIISFLTLSHVSIYLKVTHIVCRLRRFGRIGRNTVDLVYKNVGKRIHKNARPRGMVDDRVDGVCI